MLNSTQAAEIAARTARPPHSTDARAVVLAVTDKHVADRRRENARSMHEARPEIGRAGRPKFNLPTLRPFAQGPPTVRPRIGKTARKKAARARAAQKEKNAP